MFDFPPPAFALSDNWDISALTNLGGSFALVGANIAIWQFVNRNNNYSVRMLIGDVGLGARLGFGIRGLTDTLNTLIGGLTSSATAVSLNERCDILSPFSATELVHADIDRLSFGVSAGASVGADVLWIKPLMRRRNIIKVKTGGVSVNPAVEINILSLGNGKLYFPV